MEHLLSQMRQLRIPAMASALEQQWQTPNIYDELSFEERLTLLVEQEHLSRDNNRIKRLRKQANLRLQAKSQRIYATQLLGAYVKNRCNRCLKVGTCSISKTSLSQARQAVAKPSWVALLANRAAGITIGCNTTA